MEPLIHWSAIVAESVRSRFSENLYLKNKVENDYGRYLVSMVSIHYTNVHTPTQTAHRENEGNDSKLEVHFPRLSW